ncbi:MAG: S-adenosyl-l-methionine hydroxide adenosyltransferase family protein [Halolamina sp.]
MLTLASDFGSPYPAAMRGVVCREAETDPRLVDVAHDLPRQDVRAAAFWMRFVLPEFPPAVHLAVVDPGVGTDRDALVVRAGDHVLVGPDNGSLLPPARALAAATGDGDDDDWSALAVAVDDPDSATFHGRDVFAPTAATVHDAVAGEADDDWTATDERLRAALEWAPTDPVELTLPAPTVDGDVARGEVLVVDDFGNAITNLPSEVLAGVDRVAVNGTEAPAVDTFAAVDPGERLVTVGSHGNVECDVNRGRGAAAFDLAAGDEVVLRPVE